MLRLCFFPNNKFGSVQSWSLLWFFVSLRLIVREIVDRHRQFGGIKGCCWVLKIFVGKTNINRYGNLLKRSVRSNA
ncbi:hypothetical protein RchiOBHm_Chr6g0257271 [Rosa chinensis]|uniref:Uncharacterized protein n=1 Tax=Rosa chinensis TaxID=74649 RepID=A0A2P6PME5_ROSCH|nr:hypothetical protein RchiOBHm_Chr6g0257271 [Rosa chinensis]